MKKEDKGICELEKAMKNRRIKLVAMIAPSFAAEFEYPKILCDLKEAGFDKAVELTFGAKMINREYHRILEENNLKSNNKRLIIASVCPGIVETIKNKYPQYRKNLILVNSPMAAMAKICKKAFPKHKTVFIGPCNFKKIEASRLKEVDYAIDYQELKRLINDKDKEKKCSLIWDRFYNDYTKIYPLAGGLSKTAHLKGVLKENEVKIIEGIADVEKFLQKPDKKIKFLDVNFCKGGCVGGPCLSKNLTLVQKKKKLMKYLEIAKKEKIPEKRKGLIENADGIKFLYDNI